MIYVLWNLEFKGCAEEIASAGIFGFLTGFKDRANQRVGVNVELGGYLSEISESVEWRDGEVDSCCG